ncbi:thioredoxin family protein [Ferrovum sp. PN-J185]|uniref:TlpA family protein disulfide reductase n=1 Tax=Ferrovum sp. PN-J185 TaxID=1356306 RepID=UPI001E624EB7|nr:thioredoxin family protein [Ferrovum sp. PN-J185]MCC6068926.1 thioredoxin family protein [Ferrovum sp. PN-J185]
MKKAIALSFIAAVSTLSITACTPTSRLHVGSEAPKIRTKTLQDVGGDMARITTYRQPDKRMYQYSLDQALSTGKPIMLEFATPGHCTVCDRQLQEVKALLDKYQGQVIFLHMDQYENPDAFKAYQVMGDPWNFFIDGKGIVRYEQPGPMLMTEMDAAIQRMLPKQNNAKN